MLSTDDRTSPPARKTPWWIRISPELIAETAHVSIGHYYTDPAAMLEGQRLAAEVFGTEFGIKSIGYGSDPPAYLGVAALGGELVFPDNHAPMVANYAIQSEKDLRELQSPEPSRFPLMLQYVQFFHYIRAQVGDDSPVFLGHGQEGPVTTAVLLRGTRFFFDLIDRPSLAHKVLDLATEVYIRFAKFARQISGLPKGAWELCDDHAGNIRPEMWPEFVVPYWRRIYDALGGERRLHSELLHQQHLKFVHGLNIVHLDFGEDQHITLQEAVNTLRIPFSWHILSVQDLMQGTPERIREKYRWCVLRGAPIMAADVFPGTPQENIRAFITVARGFD